MDTKPVKKNVEVLTIPTLGWCYTNYKRQSNRVTSSKYTWWNFLFLNLFHQMSTLANLYFFIIGIFQMIPRSSTSGGLPTTYVPLTTILVVNGLRAMFEDLASYKNDKMRNNTLYWILSPLNTKKKSNHHQYVDSSSDDVNILSSSSRHKQKNNNGNILDSEDYYLDNDDDSSTSNSNLPNGGVNNIDGNSSSNIITDNDGGVGSSIRKSTSLLITGGTSTTWFNSSKKNNKKKLSLLEYSDHDNPESNTTQQVLIDHPGIIYHRFQAQYSGTASYPEQEIPELRNLRAFKKGCTSLATDLKNPKKSIRLPGLELEKQVAKAAFEACKPQTGGLLSFFGIGNNNNNNNNDQQQLITNASLASSPSRHGSSMNNSTISTDLNGLNSPNTATNVLSSPSSTYSEFDFDTTSSTNDINNDGSNLQQQQQQQQYYINEPDDFVLTRAIQARKDLIHQNYDFKLCTAGTLKVGQICKIYKNQLLPADMILLGTSDPRNSCFIDKANLNGETTLEILYAPYQLKKYFNNTINNNNSTTSNNTNNEQQQQTTNNDSSNNNIIKTPTTINNNIHGNTTLYDLDFRLDYTPPNGDFDDFRCDLSAYYHHDPTTQPIKFTVTSKQLLLSETVIRNTDYVIGLVIYTGDNTKISQSLAAEKSTKGEIKSSKMMKLVNHLVFILFFIQLGISLIVGSYYGYWVYTHGAQQHWYLNFEHVSIFEGFLSALFSAFSWCILCSTLVPISLLVSLETAKLFMSWFIEWDNVFYNPTLNRGAKCNTSTIHEELGLVDFIFTDKTGTLTENKMMFRYLSVAIHNPFDYHKMIKLNNNNQDQKEEKDQEEKEKNNVITTTTKNKQDDNDGEKKSTTLSTYEKLLIKNLTKYKIVNFGVTQAFETFGSHTTDISRKVAEKQALNKNKNNNITILNNPNILNKLPHEHPYAYLTLPKRWTASLYEQNLINPCNAPIFFDKQWNVQDLSRCAYQYNNPFFIENSNNSNTNNNTNTNNNSNKQYGSDYSIFSYLLNTANGHGISIWYKALRTYYIINEKQQEINKLKIKLKRKLKKIEMALKIGLTATNQQIQQHNNNNNITMLDTSQGGYTLINDDMNNNDINNQQKLLENESYQRRKSQYYATQAANKNNNHNNFDSSNNTTSSTNNNNNVGDDYLFLGVDEAIPTQQQLTSSTIMTGGSGSGNISPLMNSTQQMKVNELSLFANHTPSLEEDQDFNNKNNKKQTEQQQNNNNNMILSEHQQKLDDVTYEKPLVSTFNVANTMLRHLAQKRAFKNTPNNNNNTNNNATTNNTANNEQQQTSFITDESNLLSPSSINSNNINGGNNNDRPLTPYELAHLTPRLNWEREYYLSLQHLLGSFGEHNRDAILTTLWSKNWATIDNFTTYYTQCNTNQQTSQSQQTSTINGPNAIQNQVYIAPRHVRESLFRFMRHMALSSTVKAYRKPDGRLDWQFESAEELSMVKFAFSCGFIRDIHPSGEGTVLYIKEYFTPNFSGISTSSSTSTSTSTSNNLDNNNSNNITIDKQLSQLQYLQRTYGYNSIEALDYMSNIYKTMNTKIHCEVYNNIATLGFTSKRARVSIILQRNTAKHGFLPYATNPILSQQYDKDINTGNISLPLFDINNSLEGFNTYNQYSTYLYEYDYMFRNIKLLELKQQEQQEQSNNNNNIPSSPTTLLSISPRLQQQNQQNQIQDDDDINDDDNIKIHPIDLLYINDKYSEYNMYKEWFNNKTLNIRYSKENKPYINILCKGQDATVLPLLQDIILTHNDNSIKKLFLNNQDDQDEDQENQNNINSEKKYENEFKKLNKLQQYTNISTTFTNSIIPYTNNYHIIKQQLHQLENSGLRCLIAAYSEVPNRWWGEQFEIMYNYINDLDQEAILTNLNNGLLDLPLYIINEKNKQNQNQQSNNNSSSVNLTPKIQMRNNNTSSSSSPPQQQNQNVNTTLSPLQSTSSPSPPSSSTNSNTPKNKNYPVKDLKHELFEFIEKMAGLTLLGNFAMEDKIQPLVPETIRDFRRAGIRCFMITGDKSDVAKNIGLAIDLIDSDMVNNNNNSNSNTNNNNTNNNTLINSNITDTMTIKSNTTYMANLTESELYHSSANNTNNTTNQLINNPYLPSNQMNKQFTIHNEDKYVEYQLPDVSTLIQQYILKQQFENNNQQQQNNLLLSSTTHNDKDNTTANTTMIVSSTIDNTNTNNADNNNNNLLFTSTATNNNRVGILPSSQSKVGIGRTMSIVGSTPINNQKGNNQKGNNNTLELPICIRNYYNERLIEITGGWRQKYIQHKQQNKHYELLNFIFSSLVEDEADDAIITLGYLQQCLLHLGLDLKILQLGLLFVLNDDNKTNPNNNDILRFVKNSNEYTIISRQRFIDAFEVFANSITEWEAIDCDVHHGLTTYYTITNKKQQLQNNNNTNNVDEQSQQLQNNNTGIALLVNRAAFNIIFPQENTINPQTGKLVTENEPLSILAQKFLILSVFAKSCICAQALPSNKAKIVTSMGKLFPDAIKIAIGDGCNDVQMIKKANVGIGLAGLEGSSAANNSDYVINANSFYHLHGLLFKHGTLSYIRTEKIILLMFYKGSMMAFTHILYGFFSSFSGQQLYLDILYQLYNVMYTCWCVLLMVLSTPIPHPVLENSPVIYREIKSNAFNIKLFFKWMFKALIHALILFFIPTLFILYDNNESFGSSTLITNILTYIIPSQRHNKIDLETILLKQGKINSHLYSSNIILCAMATVPNLLSFLLMESINLPFLLIVGISMLTIFFTIGIVSLTSVGIAGDLYGAAYDVLTNIQFWLILLITIFTPLLLEYSTMLFKFHLTDLFDYNNNKYNNITILQLLKERIYLRTLIFNKLFNKEKNINKSLLLSQDNEKNSIKEKLKNNGNGKDVILDMTKNTSFTTPSQSHNNNNPHRNTIVEFEYENTTTPLTTNNNNNSISSSTPNTDNKLQKITLSSQYTILTTKDNIIQTAYDVQLKGQDPDVESLISSAYFGEAGGYGVRATIADEYYQSTLQHDKYNKLTQRAELLLREIRVGYATSTGDNNNNGNTNNIDNITQRSFVPQALLNKVMAKQQQQQQQSSPASSTSTNSSSTNHSLLMPAQYYDTHYQYLHGILSRVQALAVFRALFLATVGSGTTQFHSASKTSYQNERFVK